MMIVLCIALYIFVGAITWRVASGVLNRRCPRDYHDTFRCENHQMLSAFLSVLWLPAIPISIIAGTIWLIVRGGLRVGSMIDSRFNQHDD